ncbi:radical SAM protein, partial [Haloferax sp. Atlit-47N]
WPEKAREGIRIIAEHNTPGDTAAFGLESADPNVMSDNNLNVTADQCFEAVKIVNEVAGWRPGGDRDTAPNFGDDAARRLPKLLPGINLVHGLKGETRETFEHNKRFLQRVYDEGLMLRRVNIRQVMAFEGTDMADTGADIAKDHKQLFKQYK